MTECYNLACPYCVDYQCRRTCTCDMRLDGEYVKVVRCKDCKWFNDIGCAMRIVDDSDKPKDDDYCSFGERRDEMKELTKEEAITIISDMRSEYNLSCDPKEVPKYRALSMAIEALRDKLETEERQSNW